MAAASYKGFKTFSFHQGNLGASYSKPTRLLVKTSLGLPPFCYIGVPSFDNTGYYTGPLPIAKGMGSIRARQSTGPFKTLSTEKWPAKMLLATCTSSATSASKGSGEVLQQQQETPASEMPPFLHVLRKGGRLLGGSGPPRICKVVGGAKPFHDGGGLCSPGRWPHDRRELAEGRNWDWLRQSLFKAVLDFAGGPKPSVWLQEERKAALWSRMASYRKTILKIWSDWIEAQELGVEGLLERGTGQPLRLRLIRALLQAADDPDRDFLLRAEKGLPVGILEPLPRTPHVFEEQEKWPLDSDPWEPSLAWVPNYSSAREHSDFAKERFEEEIAEGLMEKISMESFRHRYGENSAIAALAVIVEDEEIGKKRLIHDATHGVRVHHRIRCRDKLRAPGAREKKQLLLEMMERGEVAFLWWGIYRRPTGDLSVAKKNMAFWAAR